MITFIFSRLIILVFGTLYPAYASYKAVRTKNVKEYVKWMMYWIVFAFFTCIETCTDIFLSWFPFYYEVKVLIVIWLLSPATKGSSMLYRKFVHPMLTRHEQEIDDYLNQAKERGYSAVLQLGSKGVNYATGVIMQTAIKTVQYSLNAANGTGSSSHMLTTSQSEGAIYHRPLVTQNDVAGMPDTIDNAHIYRVMRSSSLDAASAIKLEFSDDEQIGTTATSIISELIENELGAARIREPPVRKVRERRAHAKESKTKSTGLTTVVRSRRKLREATPDMDIEVE